MPIIIKSWIAIALMLGSANLCITLLHSQFPSIPDQNLSYWLYLASPWALLVLSIRSWYRLYIWRRISNLKAIAHHSMRGSQQMPPKIVKAGLLEYSCGALFCLSVSTIFHLYSIPYFEVAIAITIMISLALRLCRSVVK